MQDMRAEPMHKREEMAAVWPHSIRYGREVGTTMLIFIMAMAYSATSPIILPFALVYFVFTWCAPRLPSALPCPLCLHPAQQLQGHHIPDTRNLQCKCSLVSELLGRSTASAAAVCPAKFSGQDIAAAGPSGGTTYCTSPSAASRAAAASGITSSMRSAGASGSSPPSQVTPRRQCQPTGCSHGLHTHSA